eukprot:m.348566 g.348566  ORF g.348566 m.348566 type:complete len:272 (-) comp37895_c0_seq1:59-874(-)
MEEHEMGSVVKQTENTLHKKLLAEGYPDDLDAIYLENAKIKERNSWLALTALFFALLAVVLGSIALRQGIVTEQHVRESQNPDCPTCYSPSKTYAFLNPHDMHGMLMYTNLGSSLRHHVEKIEIEKWENSSKTKSRREESMHNIMESFLIVGARILANRFMDKKLMSEVIQNQSLVYGLDKTVFTTQNVSTETLDACEQHVFWHKFGICTQYHENHLRVVIRNIQNTIDPNEVLNSDGPKRTRKSDCDSDCQCYTECINGGGTASGCYNSC